jgi:hypothetical protein
MKEYKKLKRIEKFSNVVGCLKRFNSGKIELFLIVLLIIILILCIMNILIIPFNPVKIKPLFGLRITIIFFFSVSLIVSSINKICRMRKKLTSGYTLCFGFFLSLGCLCLVPVNFLFTLISAIITYHKVKNYNGNTRYDYSSILAIDVFTLLIIIVLFFFWYAEVLFVYSKVKHSETLKDNIDNKKKYFEGQSGRVVNVDISEKFSEKGDKKKKVNKQPGKNVEFDDITSSNKVNINNEDKESNKSKDDNNENIDNIDNIDNIENISNKEEDITHDNNENN